MIDWKGINKLLSSNINMKEVENNLKEIGIDIFDCNGNMKSLTDVLEELSEKWDGTSKDS